MHTQLTPTPATSAKERVRRVLIGWRLFLLRSRAACVVDALDALHGQHEGAPWFSCVHVCRMASTTPACVIDNGTGYASVSLCAQLDDTFTPLFVSAATPSSALPATLSRNSSCLQVLFCIIVQAARISEACSGVAIAVKETAKLGPSTIKGVDDLGTCLGICVC
jgi:hypothetical protein